MIAGGSIGHLPLVKTTISRDRSLQDVRCVQGANEQNVPIRGRTVAWARTHLVHALNIAPLATAFVDGLRVDESHLLKGGQCLEFLLALGRKGLGEVFTRESLIERMGMTPGDFEDLLEAGLPFHRMRDGTLRITETELDRFLELRAGTIAPSGDGIGIEPSVPRERDLSTPEFGRGGLHTKREAARILHVSERTINRWAASGALKVIKKGRIFLVDRVEIERFMRKNSR